DTWLTMYAARGDYDRVMHALAQGAEPWVYIDGNTALTQAIEGKHPAIAMIILAHDRALIDRPTALGDTPLTLATEAILALKHYYQMFFRPLLHRLQCP